MRNIISVEIYTYISIIKYILSSNLTTNIINLISAVFTTSFLLPKINHSVFSHYSYSNFSNFLEQIDSLVALQVCFVIYNIIEGSRLREILSLFKDLRLEKQKVKVT